MTTGLSSLKNIVCRFIYKLDFFCLSKLQTDAKLCSTESDIFQEGCFVKFECGNGDFQYFENRTKTFEVFSMFSAKELYKNKQFYLQYLATNQYLQSQHNIQRIFCCVR